MSHAINRICCTVVFIFALMFFHPGVYAQANGQIISRITIKGTDIFDFESSVSLRKAPYTWINALHIQTKEQVINRELLFKVGEPMDDFLVRETERNLRALPFIAAARIARFPQKDGTVALVVYVRDAWTTEPQINLSGLNGVDTVEFGFKEKNFLGYGKTVQTFYKTDPTRTERSIGYFDPRLLGTRWQLDADTINASDGKTKSLILNRPFFSALTRWSGRISHRHEDLLVKEYQNNVQVSNYDQTRETNEFKGALKLGSSKDLVTHAGLRYRRMAVDYNRTDTTPEGRAVPDHEHLQTVYADFDAQHNVYEEYTRVEKMTRVEDINLGGRFEFSPGLSPKALTGIKNTTELFTSFEKYTTVRKEDLFYFKGVYGSRGTFEQPLNEKYTIQAKYYLKKFESQTWVFHARSEWGNRLDLDNAIKLGNDSGLRAFKKDAFIGEKSLLFNIENRYYLIEEWADLVSVGGVVFYDAGYSWGTSDTVSMSDLKSDVGAGLRFGLTKSSNEVIVRMDIAYRLQKADTGDPHIVFSFGTSQAF